MGEAEGHVGLDGEVREQGVVLEDHPHAPRLRRHGAAGPGDALPSDLDHPRVRRLEARHEAERRGLAAAGRPEERQHLAGGRGQRQGVHGRRRVRAEALGHALEAEEGHGEGSRRRGSGRRGSTPATRIASTTGPRPARTSASAGTAASTQSDSDGPSPDRDRERLEAERSEEQCRRQLLHHVDEDQRQRRRQAPAREREVDRPKRTEPARPERAGRLVETPRDPGEARLDTLAPDGQEADEVGEQEPRYRAGDKQPGRGAGEPREPGRQRPVEPREREEHAHRDDRARERVPEAGQAGCAGHERRRLAPERVCEERGHRRHDERRDPGEGEALDERAAEALRHVALPGRRDGPEGELADGQPEGEGQRAETQGRGGDRADAPEREARRGPRQAARVGEPGAPARPTLECQEQAGQPEQDGRELGRGRAVEHAVPHAIDGLGQGPHAERRHGAEVGQRLHARERGAGGERGARERQGHPEEDGRPGPAEPPRALEELRGLLGERRARQRVDIRVVDECHHERDTPARREGRGSALPGRASPGGRSGSGRRTRRARGTRSR